MTVELWPDEWNVPCVFELHSKPPGDVDVDLDSAGATWTAATVEPVRDGTGTPVVPARWTATVLICGPLVSPVPAGNVPILTDVLPRVRCGGQITTDQWVRLRQVST